MEQTKDLDDEARRAIEAAGGLITANEVAVELGLTQQAVNARVRRARKSGSWHNLPRPVAYRSEDIPLWTRWAVRRFGRTTSADRND